MFLPIKSIPIRNPLCHYHHYMKRALFLCSSLSNQSRVDRLKDTLKSDSSPSLGHFIQSSDGDISSSSSSNLLSFTEPFVANRKNQSIPYIDESLVHGNGKKVHIKTYGCQMNVNDTQIASTILSEAGYELVSDMNKAEIVFLMTCAIREHAEAKIWSKLKELRQLKMKGVVSQIGVLGCMAERLKMKLLDREKSVDLIVGPDAYRELPRLLAVNHLTGQNAVNVLLSLDETYQSVMPTLSNAQSKTAFVSIMRGCDNMCSYCIVPFTRGRERSRPIESILDEIKVLSSKGIKEVTLLGQNVNSYRDLSNASSSSSQQSSSTSNDHQLKSQSLADGFKTIYRPKQGGLTFDVLLDCVARVDPTMRVRFTSPHPKDFPDQVLRVINAHDNIAKCIHLPAQSGSDSVLARMRRGYTKDTYLRLVDRIKNIIPDCGLTSDFIAGFCGETDEEHEETLDLIRQVNYNQLYVFHYSMREKTHAFHQMKDDVPRGVKIARLEQISRLQREMSLSKNKSLIGKTQIILIEGDSKKSSEEFSGRNDANVKVIVPKMDIPIQGSDHDGHNLKPISIGDYIAVRIEDCSAITLKARPLYHHWM